NQQIFRRANVQKEFAKRARKWRKRGRTVVLGKNGFRFVALVRLDEPQLLEVPGKRRLCDAHLLLGEAAAKLFLADDRLTADQAENLAVAKCFPCAHALTNIQTPAFLYNCF